MMFGENFSGFVAAEYSNCCRLSCDSTVLGLDTSVLMERFATVFRVNRFDVGIRLQDRWHHNPEDLEYFDFILWESSLYTECSIEKEICCLQ
jgi:hypothetical protein